MYTYHIETLSPLTSSAQRVKLSSIMKKIRLDHLLVQTQIAVTREKAQALIMAGLVLVNDQKIDKSGQLVPEDAQVRLLGAPSPYVSRGGEKLEGAYRAFGFSMQGKTVLDVGISTGGFSDFLFQNGANYVFGVDVGYGQTDLKVRNNPHLILLERTNARDITEEILRKSAQKQGFSPELVKDIALVVMDVSFISVTKVLPVMASFVSKEADYIVLIKPQFEAEKHQIGKGGIVKDPLIQQAILEKVEGALSGLFTVVERCPSPIKGTKGNQEYFFWLKPLV